MATGFIHGRMVEFSPRRLPLRIQKVITEAAVAHGVTMATVLSESQSKSSVAGRRAAALALHAQGLTLPEIGGYLDRHHTSILNLIGRKGVRAIAAQTPTSDLDLSGEWV